MRRCGEKKGEMAKGKRHERDVSLIQTPDVYSTLLYPDLSSAIV
jgi:hypothetical protein